jgi:RES domain
MTPSEKNQYIRTLTKIDGDIDDFTTLLDILMDDLAVSTVSLVSKKLYRCREIRACHISDLWYCPAKISKIGRLNREGESVLYTSPSWQTSILECNLKPGCIVTIAEIEPKNKKFFTANMAHLGLSLNKIGNNVLEYMNNDPTLEIGYLANVADSSDTDWIDKFNLNAACNFMISKLFTDDDDIEISDKIIHYEITNLLWDRYKKIPNLDGAIYPSIKNDMTSLNAAFTHDYCDEKLKISNFWEFEIPSEFFSKNISEINQLETFTTIRKGAPNYVSGLIDWE